MVIEQLKSDVKMIRTLLNGYKNEIGEKQLTEEHLMALEKAILGKDIDFFVVKQEQEIIAMCSISKTFSTFSCNYSGVFEDFYVVPKYKKQGIAKALAEFCI